LSEDADNPGSDLTQVTTRLATAADHDAVVACVRAAYTPYIAEIGVAPAPLHDDYAAHIALGRVWLAVHNGEVAGVMVILIERDHLLIDNYAVYPEWQNRGISKRLTAVAMQQARRRGLGKLRLYTHAKMTKNLALYRRRGWIEVERRTEHGFDRVYMERALGAEEGWP
jgi:GNAT superfamily N-acetyltransferase